MFNAFITISLAAVVGAVMYTDLPREVKIGSLVLFFLWSIGVTVWTSYMAIKYPRLLMYGPRELLEQNRIEYQHNLAVAKLQNSQKKQE